MFLRLLVYIAGLGFLGFSVWTFVDVSIFTRYYNMGLDSPDSRIAIRAAYGGFEIAFAFLILCGGWVSMTLRQRAWIALVGYAGLALARFGAMLIDLPPPRGAWVELGVELVLVALLGAALATQKNAN